jgi:carbonic anhydrase
MIQLRKFSAQIRIGLGCSVGVLAMAGNLWAGDEDRLNLQAVVATNSAPYAWQYDGDQGPSHWGKLSPTTASCDKGIYQSPINIQTDPHLHSHDGLLIHYNAAPAHVVTSRHTVEVDFQENGALEILGRSYSLTEFHFHEPSEHQINGLSYPMETHLVHQDATGHLVVLAVLMDLGVESASLAAVWEQIPNDKQGEVRNLLINPQDLLPNNLHHYSYDGSLTTPPCTEGVHWIVFKTPIAITASHLERFTALVGHNARPVQPLNEREIDEE